MSDENLKTFRVLLSEDPSDTFQIAFECSAEDAGHAVEQAENAYPGCKIRHTIQLDTNPLAKFVIYSPNEAAINDGAGFWGDNGWGAEESATVYSAEEKDRFMLPVATGNDATWLPANQAQATSVEAAPAPTLLVSLDGGKSFVPAPSGVRIIYANLPTDEYTPPREVHLTCTTEGLVTDLWENPHTDEEEYTGTYSATIEDIVDYMR